MVSLHIPPHIPHHSNNLGFAPGNINHFARKAIIRTLILTLFYEVKRHLWIMVQGVRFGRSARTLTLKTWPCAHPLPPPSIFSSKIAIKSQFGKNFAKVLQLLLLQRCNCSLKSSVPEGQSRHASSHVTRPSQINNFQPFGKLLGF